MFELFKNEWIGEDALIHEELILKSEELEAYKFIAADYFKITIEMKVYLSSIINKIHQQ